MDLTAPPTAAGWRHRGLRDGFEVVFVAASADGHRLSGHTTATESGAHWSVGYDVTTDGRWRTVSAHVSNLTATGRSQVTVARDARDRWSVDGERRPDLDGCVDVDLESSAVTNTLPIHRLDLVVGSGVDVPAAFVRADDLRVERLEQRYTLAEVRPDGLVVHYESSTFDFACDLEYDPAGFVTEYPGIAARES